jgi:hypothetical protein
LLQFYVPSRLYVENRPRGEGKRGVRVENQSDPLSILVDHCSVPRAFHVEQSSHI